MSDRPILDKNIDSKIFREFYYLKEELVDFCRKNDLPISGSKLEITERIAEYLDTGLILTAPASRRKTTVLSTIEKDTIIESEFICSEKHRAFFKEHIGNQFSFNVMFQKWLKNNTGKTYEDAIEAYYQIIEDKKKGKKEIERQFEYNTYIRDFFADNKGKSLDEAIQCWKYKKQKQGHHRYEKEDLAAIKHITLKS